MKRDHALRKRAFHQFYEEFQDHQFTLASSLSYSVKADVFRARARNYPSALEASLFRDDVPVAVYDGLISAVRQNLAPLFRYYELRRRVLGLAELHQYDTYVPLVAEIDSHVTFDEAIEQILAAFAPLGPEYITALSEGLRGRWCDRYETKGKRSGAFSSGSFGAPPYILMNYKSDVFSDVYTLAHEAGHSMHTWFAQRSQTFQDYDYPIFLAEVASTFNEELLTHHLLEKTEDQKDARLHHQPPDRRHPRHALPPDDVRRVRESHPRDRRTRRRPDARCFQIRISRAASRPISAKASCSIRSSIWNACASRISTTRFTSTNTPPAFRPRSRSRSECSRGNRAAWRPISTFLKSGGSKFPLETLQAAGVDMTTPAPIESTLRLFERRLTELEALLAS